MNGFGQYGSQLRRDSFFRSEHICDPRSRGPAAPKRCRLGAPFLLEGFVRLAPQRGKKGAINVIMTCIVKKQWDEASERAQPRVVPAIRVLPLTRPSWNLTKRIGDGGAVREMLIRWQNRGRGDKHTRLFLMNFGRLYLAEY